jgi:hypothetical protein
MLRAGSIFSCFRALLSYGGSEAISAMLKVDCAAKE